MTHTVHAIIDPLCGWCYGAAPLLEAVASLPRFEVKLYGGGLMTGSRRARVDAQFRAFVQPHDERIGQLSGQTFGAAYQESLLTDESIVLDSEPPITALLAVQQLGGDTLGMLHSIQRGHYADGLCASDPDVLEGHAVALGHDRQAFRSTFESLAGEKTREHIESSRSLLAQLRGEGFPTIAMNAGSTTYTTLDHGPYYGRPDDWREYVLAQQV